MAEANSVQVSVPRARSETLRRIRVGLSGIAGILLLLAAASAILERIAKQSPKPSATATVPQLNGVAAPTEPMAGLGVAPAAAEPEKPAVAPITGTPK